MSEPLTPADLDAIEGRLKAATPGPWHPRKATTELGYGTQTVCLDAEGDGGPDDEREVWLHGRNVAVGLSGNDAAFIAHAPDDIAALLAEVRRLAPKPKVAVWEQGVGGWSGYVILRDVETRRRLGSYRRKLAVVHTYNSRGYYDKRFNSEPEARAHIEAWARSKGWEVRDAG